MGCCYSEQGRVELLLRRGLGRCKGIWGEKRLERWLGWLMRYLRAHVLRTLIHILLLILIMLLTTDYNCIGLLM
jgi:hypothetical protein